MASPRCARLSPPAALACCACRPWRVTLGFVAAGAGLDTALFYLQVSRG